MQQNWNGRKRRHWLGRLDSNQGTTFPKMLFELSDEFGLISERIGTTIRAPAAEFPRRSWKVRELVPVSYNPVSA